MALQFQGAPDWLLQEYFNRKQPAEIANESIGQSLQAMAQYKQLQDQKQQKGLDSYLKAFEVGGPKFAGDIAGRVGLQKPPALPGQASPQQAGTAPTPYAAGTIPPGQETPIMQAWNQMKNPQPAGAPSSEAPVGLPSMDLLDQGKYGQTQFDAQLKLANAYRDAKNDAKPKEADSLDKILAELYRNGDITLDQFIQKKAESQGAIAESKNEATNRVKLAKEKPKATASYKNTLREYDNMIKEAEDIANDPALKYATGVASPLGAIPGFGPKRVASRLETLKAKTLLNVLASLKELSSTGASGFGQLSNIEGENLRNSISTLDRGLGSGDFKASINRFVAELKQRKNVIANTYSQTYGSVQGGGGAENPGNNDPLGIR